MTHAIIQELKLRADYLGDDVIETIYFGGGTPSVLTSDEIADLLTTITTTYRVHQSPEITLEANPDDLTENKLAELRAAGINRLSIGIQSFHDEELKFLHRAHNAAHAIQCIEDARKAGFNNISIDLIYGIPGQSEESWHNSIETALKLLPEHISAYSLTIEEKTVFGRLAAKGKLKIVDDDVSAAHLLMLISALDKKGFEHYEISNFARPGFISKHNSNYWRQKKYLGVGPSAHSYDLKTRQFNVANNHEYLRNINAGKIPSQVEVLSPEDNANDYILTGLRTSWGINLTTLKETYQYDLLSHHTAYLDQLHRQGLANVVDTCLTLTRSGRMLADKIATDLFMMHKHV